MKTAFFILACLLMIGCGTSGQDNPKQPRGAFQEVLDNTPFRFKENEASAQYSVEHLAGKGQVQVIANPRNPLAVTFTFARAGKEVLVLEGHGGSAFRAYSNLLFFADFSPIGSGCAIAAYDLGSGTEIWRTKLEAVGDPSHSKYRNAITMGLSSMDGKGEGVVTITGSESYGDYIEVLDRRTGKQLAHRIYRQGFGR